MTPTERVMREIARQIVDNTRVQNRKGEFVMSRDEAVEVMVAGLQVVAYRAPEGRVLL